MVVKTFGFNGRLQASKRACVRVSICVVTVRNEAISCFMQAQAANTAAFVVVFYLLFFCYLLSFAAFCKAYKMKCEHKKYICCCW